MKKKTQKHQLCEMGVYLYPSVFYMLFYLFTDPAGRYDTVQLL